MLHALHLEVAVLEAVDLGREERRDEDKLAKVDGQTVLRAQVVLEGALRRVDPVRSLDLRRIQVPQRVGTRLEVVLDAHLVVDLVLRLDELAFRLLHLQVEHVDVLGLGEAPAQVLIDHFDGVVDQVTVRREAHGLLRVQLGVSQKVVEDRLRALRPYSPLVPVHSSLDLFLIVVLSVTDKVLDAENGRIREYFRQSYDLELADHVLTAELRHEKRPVRLEVPDTALVAQPHLLVFLNWRVHVAQVHVLLLLSVQGRLVGVVLIWALDQAFDLT